MSRLFQNIFCPLQWYNQKTIQILENHSNIVMNGSSEHSSTQIPKKDGFWECFYALLGISLPFLVGIFSFLCTLSPFHLRRAVSRSDQLLHALQTTWTKTAADTVWMLFVLNETVFKRWMKLVAGERASWFGQMIIARISSPWLAVKYVKLCRNSGLTRP